MDLCTACTEIPSEGHLASDQQANFLGCGDCDDLRRIEYYFLVVRLSGWGRDARSDRAISDLVFYRFALVLVFGIYV